MLTRTQKSFSRKSNPVKSIRTATGALITAALLSASMTTYASTVTETRFSVRFDKSLTQTEDGLETVLELFEKEAKKVCRAGKPVNEEGLVISYETCMKETIAQLVESANLESLTTFYSKVASAE